MKRIRMAVMTGVLLPLVTLAAPPQQQDANRQQDTERMEQRERTRNVVGLAEELDLDTSQALKLDETMRKFDERRRPLREQVRESARILERAAEGDSAALSQVDQAAQKAFDARAQLAALDREMFQALTKDLSPQKRAQLALYLAHARMERQAMRLDKLHEMQERFGPEFRQRMRQRFGPGGPGGPGRMGPDDRGD
jgi:hypothetical protein